MIYTPEFPSFRNGWAECPGVSRFPDMWEGLIGEYVMGLDVQGGTVEDLSGHERHGTVNNAVWTAGGANAELPATSLDFDGDTDYVSLPWTHNSNVYSVIGWVCRHATGVLHTIVDTRDANGDGWIVAVSNATDTILVAHNSVQPLGSTTLDANDWHHFCVTSDGSTVAIYLDGIDDGASPSDISGDSAISVSTNMVIGARSFTDQTVIEWNGEMQEVRLYDRVLSPDEVWIDYNNPLSLLRRKSVYPVSKAPVAAGTTPMLTLLGVG